MSLVESRIISQYSKSPVLNEISNSLLAEIDLLRSTINDLNRYRSISLGDGQRLDLAAQIYNVIRPNGMQDDVFRAYIFATIAARNSKGKLDDITTIIRLILGNVPIKIFNYEFGAIKIEVELDIPSYLLAILSDLVSLSVPAGRRISNFLQTKPNSFRFGKTWGSGFAKPIAANSPEQKITFILPGTQSEGVLILAQSSALWSIAASGSVTCWPNNRPPNGPLGLSIADGGFSNPNFFDPNSKFGQLIVVVGNTKIPYSVGLKVTVSKGMSILFKINDNSYADNLGSFKIEIGVNPNGN